MWSVQVWIDWVWSVQVWIDWVWSVQVWIDWVWSIQVWIYWVSSVQGSAQSHLESRCGHEYIFRSTLEQTGSYVDPKIHD